MNLAFDNFIYLIMSSSNSLFLLFFSPSYLYVVLRVTETISGSYCPRPKNSMSLLLTSELCPTGTILAVDVKCYFFYLISVQCLKTKLHCKSGWPDI